MQDTTGELSTRDLAVRIVRQQRAAVKRELDCALSSYKEPVPGSGRARDLQWIADGDSPQKELLVGVFDSALYEVAELLRVAEEHSIALEILLGNDANLLPIPMMSLVRSIQEALLEVCWAVDPGLTPELRLARCAAMVLRTVQGNADPLSQLPNGSDKLLEVIEATNGVHNLLSNLGFTLNYNNSNTFVTSVSCKGSRKAALKVNVTEAASDYMRGSEHLWTIGSGATHSRNWFTKGLDGPGDLIYIMVTTPLLDFTDAVIDCTHGYLGLPVGDFHTKAHFRRVALFRRNPTRDPALAHGDYEHYAASRSLRPTGAAESSE
ncbi:hypothetical protein ABIC73_004381 [Prescottella equi]|uniref:hypothetical protein n=1 Tax=Rhodococcus hoagii TaxID=43767 RepID=UPI00339909FD